MPIIYDKKTELRKDYFLDKYVIITPARTQRPHDVVETSHKEPGHKCVLCPNTIEKNLIVDTIGGKKNWQVVSILNKFPAISLSNPKAYGQQEVIVETQQHGKELGDMTIKETLNVLKMYQKRTKFLSTIKGIEYILILKIWVVLLVRRYFILIHKYLPVKRLRQMYLMNLIKHRNIN